jgi:hypothetical protein
VESVAVGVRDVVREGVPDTEVEGVVVALGVGVPVADALAVLVSEGVGEPLREDVPLLDADALLVLVGVPDALGVPVLVGVLDGDGVVLERFTPRLVSSKGWSGLNSTEAVRVAADLLVEYGHLRPDLVWPGQAGGRPSEQYLVNPRCFGVAKERV